MRGAGGAGRGAKNSSWVAASGPRSGCFDLTQVCAPMNMRRGICRIAVNGQRERARYWEEWGRGLGDGAAQQPAG